MHAAMLGGRCRLFKRARRSQALDTPEASIAATAATPPPHPGPSARLDAFVLDRDGHGLPAEP
jgi:hypothetical protein